MNIIINKINIFYNKGHNNTIMTGSGGIIMPDESDSFTHFAINDDVVIENDAFIEQLKERVAEGERELKEFLEKYDSKNK